MSSSPRKQPAPGASLSDAGRQYSQASSAALKKLDSLDAKVEGISGRVENVVSSLSSSVAEAEDVTPLLKAKNELAQIMGDLEKLQFREVDAVDTSVLNSGKDEARSHRKQLNAAIDGLLRRTQSLYNDFNSLAEQVKAGKILPPKRRRNEGNAFVQPSTPTGAAPTRGGRIKIPIGGGPPIVEPPVAPEAVKTGKIKIVIQDGSAPSASDSNNATGTAKAPTPRGGRRTPKSTPKADPAPAAPSSSGGVSDTPKSTATEDGSAAEVAEEGTNEAAVKGPRLSREEFLERRRKQRLLARQRKAQARAEGKTAGGSTTEPEAGGSQEEGGVVEGGDTGVKETRPRASRNGKGRGNGPKKDASSTKEDDAAHSDAGAATGPEKRDLTPEEQEKRRERRRLARQRKAARRAAAASSTSLPAEEAS